MLDRKVDGIVRIRPDFARHLRLGDAEVQVLVHGTDANTARIIQGYAQGAVGQWSAAPGRRRDRSTPAGPVIVRDRLWFNEANDSHYFLVPGLIVLIMTLIGALLTALVMAREWERGTLEALFVTPVQLDEILLGKTIPYFVLGMIGLALCLLAAKFMFHVPFRGSLWVLAGASMLYLLVALAIGLLISSATKSQFVASADHDAGHVPAGDDAVGLPVRSAQHAGRGPSDHVRPAGPLLRGAAANGVSGRRRLGRDRAQRGRAGRHGGRAAVADPSVSPARELD